MKIDRHSSTVTQPLVKQATKRLPRLRYWTVRAVAAAGLAAIVYYATITTVPPSHPPSATPVSHSPTQATTEQSQPQARALIRRVIHQIAYGQAFDAKVRETVWTTGREVVGVGTYLQAGQGSGRFNLQITMHDGDGKHRIQQISDGRLAWTRTEIAGHVTLRRVDVGRLDEWLRVSNARSPQVPANEIGFTAERLRIGAWTEMLDTIERDYVIQVDPAKLNSQTVWVISGTLKDSVRQAVLAQSGRGEWPELHPTRVRVAVATEPNPNTNFGELLPTRIEFWSDPIAVAPGSDDQPARPQGRLITLVELYSIRPITPPTIEKFRFNNEDSEVNFTNETDRYIQRFGVDLTASQRNALRR